MSHHRHHEHDHEEEHEHEHRRHGDDRHGPDHFRARLAHAVRRHLRRHGDDVKALEQLQRDLEQAAADVATRVSKLRETTVQS